MNYFGSNFRGTIFELDMATRCLLSNWEIDFPEDYTKEDKAVDMIAEKTDGEKIAIECSSKRGTQTLDIQKINETINEKDEKFQPEYLELLKTQCKTKAIILDLTRSNYVNPIEQLDLSEISSCNNADGVVLTWREDFSKKRTTLFG